MALLQDLRVGTKVQIRGNHRYYPNQDGEVLVTSWCDNQVLVKLEQEKTNYWFYAVQLKIVKDEGETEMTQKTKVKQEVTPQNYILIDEDDHTRVFTDTSFQSICKASDDEWGFNADETLNRLSSGKMKLLKIEEVKLEITQPSIKIVG